MEQRKKAPVGCKVSKLIGWTLGDNMASAVRRQDMAYDRAPPAYVGVPVTNTAASRGLRAALRT